MGLPRKRYHYDHVSVIAAFGPLNERREADAHGFSDKTTENFKIDFSKVDDDQCTIDLEDLDLDVPAPWPPSKIIGETVFNARLGPPGSKRGYTAITGLPSWGIVWYLNDLLLPEITLERGIIPSTSQTLQKVDLDRSQMKNV
ncbi:unnamed protein product [Acanthoscelides obtectus]|uniref:Uncharacterized protein n=1 Tax=Acanthoscelides obtectus TaxID=200917 RepID=A0A9P0KKT9_ACAOB|nr:unnamed protein product [Acanthoscelides obtectus]CAK1646335.1 Protein Skeletor, isoforms B/C [Acanthoscelides obtectus]